MSREYNYPVFGTQGGGLAREVRGQLIFVEKPDCPGLDVGDDVPAEWDYQPANELARELLRQEELDRAVDETDAVPDSLVHPTKIGLSLREQAERHRD